MTDTDVEGRLREVPGFRRFAAGRVVVWLGHSLSLVALPVLVYQRTGSAALTGLLAAAESAPYLVLGLLVGAVVDRRDARRVLVCAPLVSAAALLTVPVADALGLLTAGHLLGVALVVGVSFVFTDAASFGVLPRLVGADRIGPATATLSAAGTVVGIAVPGLAGGLVAVVGAPVVIGIDGLLTLAGIALLGGIPWTPDPGSGDRRSTRLRDDIREGLSYVWRHPVVRPLTILGFGNSFTGGAVTGLVVVVAVERLGLPDDDGRIGLLYAAFAAGAFAGSLAIGRLHRRVAVGRVTLTGYAATALVVVAWASTTHLWVGVLLLFIARLVDSVVVLNGIVVRQTVTPMRLQGRVNTTARVIAWGGAPLGAAAGGALASAWRVDGALLACTGAVVAVLVIGLASGVGRLGRLADLPRGE